MAKKTKWYIIKLKKKKHWTAYELEPKMLKTLKEKYEYKGPYKDLLQCMIHANN